MVPFAGCFVVSPRSARKNRPFLLRPSGSVVAPELVFGAPKHPYRCPKLSYGQPGIFSYETPNKYEMCDFGGPNIPVTLQSKNSLKSHCGLMDCFWLHFVRKRELHSARNS